MRGKSTSPLHELTTRAAGSCKQAGWARCERRDRASRVRAAKSFATEPGNYERIWMELVLNANPVKAQSTTDLMEDFEGVVREQQSRVFRTLLGMLRDRDAAETLMQET